jgi:hypothetical protein
MIRVTGMFRTERLPALLLGAVLLCAGAAPRADTAALARIQALVDAGAPNLALKLLERDAPPVAAGVDWIAWEKRRLAIYAARRDWDAITARADHMPDGLPGDFRRWMLGEAAQARLAAADGRGARRYLRRLIWLETGSAEELAHWRRLVIRSYLAEQGLDDAQTALLRYQQDNKARSDVWQTLHAEILLRGGRHRAAFDVLSGVQSHAGRQLRLLAALRAGTYRPAEVRSQARRLADELKAQPVLARDAWALTAEAALRDGDLAERVVALEHALALPAPADTLVVVHPDDLWAAYDRLAEDIGNGAHLVVGDDAAWLDLARSFLEPAPTKPKSAKPEPPPPLAFRGRALAAFLTRAAAATTAEAAHKALTDALFRNGQGEVVRVLYTNSARFARVDAIPGIVRFQLADKALVEYDINLAARLIRGLVDPPQGEDRELWNLRRTRVLIYAGDYAAATVLLIQMLDKPEKLDVDFADRALQAVFDLQAADRHADAVRALEIVYRRVDNERMRRELLFWQAESRAALGNHESAAELYLHSATFGGQNGGDPWGQTALYHAAEALGKAGMIDDARNVYRRLLRATDDRKRRAMIERQMQQLWLAAKPTSP